MLCKTRQGRHFILELQGIEGIYADTVLLFLIFGWMDGMVLSFRVMRPVLMRSSHKRRPEQR